MTYFWFNLLEAAVFGCLAASLGYLWWVLRDLHRLLAQQTADLQRVETMLRDLERTGTRRAIGEPKMVTVPAWATGTSDIGRSKW